MHAADDARQRAAAFCWPSSGSHQPTGALRAPGVVPTGVVPTGAGWARSEAGAAGPGTAAGCGRRSSVRNWHAQQLLAGPRSSAGGCCLRCCLRCAGPRAGLPPGAAARQQGACWPLPPPRAAPRAGGACGVEVLSAPRASLRARRSHQHATVSSSGCRALVAARAACSCAAPHKRQWDGLWRSPSAAAQPGSLTRRGRALLLTGQRRANHTAPPSSSHRPPQRAWPTRAAAPAGVRGAAQPRARGPFTPHPSCQEPRPGSAGCPRRPRPRRSSRPAAGGWARLAGGWLSGGWLWQAAQAAAASRGLDPRPDARPLHLVRHAQAIPHGVDRREDASEYGHGAAALWTAIGW
jgi:hypothetical protein